MFKTVDGELKVFNKTILSTQNNLKNLQTQTANLSYYTSGGNHVSLQNVPIAQPQTVSNFTKLNNAFNVYNNNLTKSTGLQNAYIKSVGTQNQALGNYLAGLKGAPATFGGYIAKLTKAKLATIGLQAASIALNMALTMGVAVAISALFKGIDYLIHRTEKMQEALENSVNEFNSVSDELKSLEEELKTTTERLAELQKLADNGTISVAEEAELETLKKTNKELARKVALKQQEQAQEARDVLKDSKKNVDTLILSDYITSPNYVTGGVDNQYVTPDKELLAAIEAYEAATEEYEQGAIDTETYNTIRASTQSDIENMYKILSPTIEAYEKLMGAGIELEGEDKTRYEQLKKSQDAYLAYIYTLNGTREAFEGLNAEQQRNILLNRLIKQGLSEDVAKAIISSISDEDLDKYWDEDFSFIPPEMKDGETAEEYGKRYAEAWAKGLGEESKNHAEMMVSLSEMKTASDNLSALSSAFKQLSDDGYISIECMSKIQEATKLSGDEWEEYQTKLMRAKVGSTEFNQVMSELTNKILENEFGTIDLTNATEEEISAIEDKIEATLRENNVANASAVAQEFVAKKKAQVQIQNKIAKDGIDSVIDGLKDETNWCGLTSNAYAQLVAKEIIFNKNGLDISGKLEKLQSLYGMLELVGYKWEYLNDAMNGDPTVRDYARIKAGIYKREDENRQYEWVYNDVVYSTEDEAFAAYMINQVTKDIAAVTTSLYRNPDKNTPDYEDPTDAIINRINLHADELAQQEEEIQNLIEIAELENDYKKQISLTNDKLDIQKQKVDALKTANDELHQMAEDLRNSTPDWIEEEWFDSQGGESEAYINFINKRIEDGASKEEIEAIKDQFEKISKIKKAWVENDEERLELTKEILKTEDEIVELRFDNSQNWINQRNAYNDWALFGDSEIDAWERVVKWLKDEYPNDLDKIEEAEQSLFEARKNEFDKANDFGNTYLESRKTLLQSYYDVTNSIAEAQHEINKELETSKTMYEWLDEDTRKLLFNQEDYNTLSEELLDIQYAAQKLQRQYERDLNDSTLETIESITSQYQMQYETLMKSYEIAKADLEIAKKKQKLNNVLNERNVRMFINGQWQWVANTEDVINAKSELADAEYAKRVEEAGLTQQESINNLTRQQNELSIVIKQFENGVLDLVSATVIAKNAIESMPRSLSSMYSNVSSGIPSQQYFNISGGYSVGGYKVTNGSSSKSSSSGGLTLKVGTDGNAPSGARVGDIIETAGGNYKIVTADTEGAKYNDASRHWSIRIDEEHADGTRYTPGGMTLMGEDGFEAYINSNGHLIPINQPTIGNIASGGIVFNTDQMKGLRTLWDMSNLNIGGGHNLLYNTQPQQIDQRQDNRIIINGMTVDSGSSDGQALISALRRYVGNH